MPAMELIGADLVTRANLNKCAEVSIDEIHGTVVAE
jgi:hypothetical protein